MTKITDDIEFNVKMSELAAKQHELMLKSINPALTRYNEIVSKTVMPITETIQACLPNSLQILIDKLNEVQRIYQPIINSVSLHVDEFIPKFDSLLLTLSKSLEQINLEECSEEQKEFFTSTNTQINELNKDLASPKHKTLTWEQWLGILAFIISLIGLIKDFLPDEQIEQLTAEVQIISDNFEDYAQKDLANQELLLEKEDIQIENQEKILDVLKKNQCDCKIPD